MKEKILTPIFILIGCVLQLFWSTVLDSILIGALVAIIHAIILVVGYFAVESIINHP